MAHKIDKKITRRDLGKALGIAGAATIVGAPALAQDRGTASSTWAEGYLGTTLKFGVSCFNTANPFYAPVKVGAEDAGEQLGIEVLWTGVSDGNTVNQIAGFEQMVRTGYQAIVVIPLEAEAWIAPIRKAREAGVLVLTTNTDSPSSDRELFFGQDLKAAAVDQGEMLGELTGGSGDIALTNCAPGVGALDLRVEGASLGAANSGMGVVGIYNTNPADMAAEIATIEDIIKANPDVAGLAPLCGPDTAAAGLVRKNNGLDIPIVGHDMLYQTLELIKEGYIDATIGQQPYLQGFMPIMYAYQRVALGAPALDLPGGNYFLASEIVNKDNVDQFLIRESRFQ
ncbi:substrate-binding domain-containing protein [Ruegeria sp. EL01]|jgi:ABC-type sugar transport system substrate-binding protein|uniref:substrate-binding domain-containing protein n=1 Tax=Ruegeria sp. EL01 TaxID=2107578 RepID=UPI000EA80D71|nr:substrate-binding domain-containing protein [Ruegeria sp. EL01]